MSLPQKNVRCFIDCNWLNNDVLVAINKKRKLWKLYKQGNGSVTYENYSEQAKLTKSVIKDAKRNIEVNIANKCAKNTADFFKYLGFKRGIYNDDIILKKSNGDTVKDLFYVVSKLSNFFVSNFTVDKRQFFEKVVNDCPIRVFNEMDLMKFIGSLKN